MMDVHITANLRQFRDDLNGLDSKAAESLLGDLKSGVSKELIEVALLEDTSTILAGEAREITIGLRLRASLKGGVPT